MNAHGHRYGWCELNRGENWYKNMFPTEKWRLRTYCNSPTIAYHRKWEHLKNMCSPISSELSLSQLHRLHLANITKETASLHRHFWQSYDVPKFAIVRAGILVNSLYFDVFGTPHLDLGDISYIFKTRKIDLKGSNAHRMAFSSYVDAIWTCLAGSGTEIIRQNGVKIPIPSRSSVKPEV